KLVLLHVLEGKRAGMLDDDRRLKERRIEEELRAEIWAGDFSVEVRIAKGDAFAAILDVAREVGADVIVTGVGRIDDLGDVILGSTVERLVRHSPMPMLVVKGRVRGDYREIVVGTDFSDGAAAALARAAALFPDGRL